MRSTRGSLAIALGLAATLVGCAATKPAPDPRAKIDTADEDTVVLRCEEWTPTGSKIARVRCVEVEAADERRRRDQAWIQRENLRVPRPPPQPSGSRD
jgi:hypothetical protein